MSNPIHLKFIVEHTGTGAKYHILPRDAAPDASPLCTLTDLKLTQIFVAAPEMLEALRAMDIARQTPIVDDDFPSVIHRADVLLAKAIDKAVGRS